LKRGNLLITIPIHPGDLNSHVLRSILRQAQMTVDEFLDLL
jgi:predicted RNA binding protein YcfA (HicA-like mRNA interferase family)